MIDRILPGFAALDLRGGGVRDKRRQENGRAGATKLFAATANPAVKSFGTFTVELRALCAWLQEHKVHGVAMEATGVYWIPIHDLLQAEGFKVTLFHRGGGVRDKRRQENERAGAHARNLPGRKSDVSDPQWHAMLHSHGLLRACFIPPRRRRGLGRLVGGRAGAHSQAA